MRKLLILAVVICGTAYAFAGPTEFTFIGWDGGDWQNGYPYYIQENGGSPTILDAMCDDYVHGGEPGQQWSANITDLGSENLTLTRFNNIGGSNALYPLMLYNEAGWLLLQTEDYPNSNWMEMNYAVWNIFDPAAPCNSTCQGWLQAAQNEAKIGFPGVNFDDVYIVTPVNQHDKDPNSMQEFMYIGEGGGAGNSPSQTTPEPGTLVLMGTGVLALAGRKFMH
jgi:hypothetical protein